MASACLYLTIGIQVIGVVAVVGRMSSGRRRAARGGTDVIARPTEAPTAQPTAPPTEAPEEVGEAPVEVPVEVPVEAAEPPAPALEKPESTASRLVRLRQRLSRSQGSLGRGLLSLLSRDRLDDATWEDLEDTLLTADVGVAPTQELVEKLRTRLRVEGADGASPHDVLREELVALVDPTMDRRLAVSGAAGKPGVVL